MHRPQRHPSRENRKGSSRSECTHRHQVTMVGALEGRIAIGAVRLLTRIRRWAGVACCLAASSYAYGGAAPRQVRSRILMPAEGGGRRA